MEQKKCFKCGKLKPLSDYYKHPQMGDGNLNKCKECTKKDSTEYRNNNIDKCCKYDKDRSLLPYRRELMKKYHEKSKGSKEYKKHRYDSYKKGREKYPEKASARRKIQYYLSKGYIKKYPCSICGDTNSQAHHPDYNYPLDVIWLCDKHHKELHMKANKLQLIMSMNRSRRNERFNRQ